jgi:hydrogenase/urease accessory protein HupE
MTEPSQATGLWASISRSRKAILAALTWVVSFLAATLVATDGRWPTLTEWVIALAGALPAFGLTYQVPNAPATTVVVVET